MTYIPFINGDYENAGAKTYCHLNQQYSMEELVSCIRFGNHKNTNRYWYQVNENNLFTGKVFTTKEIMRLHKLSFL
jgi:hypothetical protein